MSKVFFGIDLGTTQCSVAYVADSSRIHSDRIVTPSLVEFRQDALSASGADRVPSVIGVDLQDKRRRDLLFGWDFLGVFDRRRRDPLTPLRRGRDFFHSVKSDMGTNRVYPFSKPPLGRSPIEVTAGLLERLSRLASENNPDLDPRKGITVITVPASFSALAREDTLQAAELAGFSRDRVQLLDEPVAALLDTVNHQSSATFLSNEFQHVLMFDFGGGTCDLALMGVRLRGDNPLGLHLETLAISPYQRLGGDDIDRAIMNTIVWPAICEEAERASLPTQVLESVSDTLVVSVARRLKEQICGDVRRRIGQRGGWSDYTRLTADVRLEARFSVPGLTFPRSYTMTAAKFEEVMRPFVTVPDDFDDPDDCPQSLVRPIWETIRQAELDPGELHRVILNGGSCLNPFVRRMLEAHLRDERRPFSDVQISEAPSLTCSVARGAALACYWQHARGERLVAPILPDSLGVIVQDGQVEPIVAAGTSLPFPGPDALCDVSGRFAVPPDCGPEMLVPFYTGYAGSPQKPRHAGTVKVKIPSGTPAGSRVTIKLRIDDDKTLAWWFVIANNPPQPADSIRDPWTQHIPDIHERELIEHRRSLRQLADEEKPFPALGLMREANFMRRAGDPRGALTVLNDVLEHFGASGALLNFRALAYDDLGRQANALADFQAATELDSGSAIARGNYGCALEDAGRLDEAIAAIRLALTMDANLAYLYERLATISRRQGREEDARRELQQAEQLYVDVANQNPLNPESWFYVSRVRQALGDYEGARKAAGLADDADRYIRLGGSDTDIVSGTRVMVRDEETN